MKAIIIPGNGNTSIESNWFPSVKRDLEDIGLEVIADNMPDPVLARCEYWLPFIKERLGSQEAVLIGHSSGAVAALRYLETDKAALAILVGVYYTHLDDEDEKKSGYFDTEWQWSKIRENASRIVTFASIDDPYIPIEQPRYIKEMTRSEYHEYIDEGHFGSDVGKTDFPEIVVAVKKFLHRTAALG